MMKDGEYPNRDGNLDSQQPVIEDSFSKYSPGNKQKTAKSSKWSLSQCKLLSDVSQTAASHLVAFAEQLVMCNT